MRMFRLILILAISSVLPLLLPAGCSREPRSVTFYFIGGEGKNIRLEPVKRIIPDEGEPKRLALEELIKGPAPESGLKPVLPDTTRILGTEEKNGIYTINLSRELIVDAGRIETGMAAERLSLAAVADTLTEFRGIQAVRIEIEGKQSGLIDGRRIEEFWGYGGLPAVLERDEKVIGKPLRDAPAWHYIDRRGLAATIGPHEISRGNENKKSIALTFDGGGTGEYAPAILDALKDQDVRCTFFLTGEFVRSYPEVARRIAADGHEIGNHSMSHRSFLSLAGNELETELALAEKTIKETAGIYSRPYFRFPFGERNEALVETIGRLGYVSVYWSIGTDDWRPETPAQAILEAVVTRLANGVIILLHCGSPQVVEILPLILKDARSAGFEVVTVSELLAP